MEYQKYKKLIKTTNNYPTETELIYKFGFLRNDLKTINEDKYHDYDYFKLPLKDENDQPLLYWNSDKITFNFFDAQDLIRNSYMDQFSDFSNSEILNGFIFSEIESTLAIEGVRSTRKHIEKINKSNYEDLKDQNDIIIKNMLIGFEFVKTEEINEANILNLYEILSKNLLQENEKLLKSHYYRHDEVTIVDGLGIIIDKGVDHNKLPQLMKDLISFINEDKTYEEHLIAPHIIHYYILYLHPYFDFNGRMARVMSFWYNYQKAPSLSLLLVSEAINNKANKSNYYNAIINSRKTNNDLTYFLEYMGNIIIKYSKVYVNFYNVLHQLKGEGHVLSRSLELALKYVLAIPVVKEGYFSWKDFMNSTNENYSKQYYLRLLNNLVEINVLEVKEHKNTNLYRLKRKRLNLY